MTGTLVITGRDRQHLLMDLWDVPGLREHILDIVIRPTDAAPTDSCTVAVDSVGALRAAWTVMDNVRTASAGNYLMLYGQYRGVPVTVCLRYHLASDALTELAALRAGGR